MSNSGGAGEDAWIRWLRRRVAVGREEEKDHLRDDTATLTASGAIVVTVDQQVTGVHFREGLDPKIVGRRLVAVNVSDLAASGARPRWALLAVQLPPGSDPQGFFLGVLAGCRRHGLELVGGDISRANDFSASLTLIGQRPRGAATLARDRARAGHAIFLGGTLGESALGRILIERGATWTNNAARLPRSLALPPSMVLAARRAVRRHLLPDPQTDLGLKLSTTRGAGAAIDVSDGFAKDLHRLCRESGVGARVDGAALAAASPRGFDELCRHLGLDPQALRLAGGEDYVLLFTAPASSPIADLPGVRRIGAIVRGAGVEIEESGARRSLPDQGWDHLAAGRSASAAPGRRNDLSAAPGRRRAGRAGRSGRRPES